MRSVVSQINDTMPTLNTRTTNLSGNGAVSPRHQQVRSLLPLSSHCYILGK